MRAIKEKFPQAKTVMGLSNVSFLLPGRAQLNRAFLHMSVAAGLGRGDRRPLGPRFYDRHPLRRGVDRGGPPLPALHQGHAQAQELSRAFHLSGGDG